MQTDLQKQIDRFCGGPHCEPVLEYNLQMLIVKYMALYHKGIEYKVDLAGSNLSKAQSGKMKAANMRRGWPDFEVLELRGEYMGLYIELKTAGTVLVAKRDKKKRLKIGEKKYKGGVIPIYENKIRKKGDWNNLHIEEQAEALEVLRQRKRFASFGVGLKKCLMILEGYLSEDWPLMERGCVL